MPPAAIRESRPAFLHSCALLDARGSLFFAPNAFVVNCLFALGAKKEGGGGTRIIGRNARHMSGFPLPAAASVLQPSSFDLQPFNIQPSTFLMRSDLWNV